MLDVDRVYGDIGELGRGQWAFAAVIFLMNGYNAWHMLQYTFVGYTLPFQCLAPDQDTPHRDQCPAGQSSRCQSLTFPSSDSESTIVSEWKLVCDQAWLSPLTMSLFMGGVMVGAVTLGGLSDAAGRRLTMVLCMAAMVIVTALSAMTSGFKMYGILKFVEGVFSAGFGLSSWVLLNELVGPSKRALVGNMMQASFSVGIILYALSASFFRHWRQLTWLSVAVGAPMFLFGAWLPKSPRWLLGKGRAAEAVAVLRRMARKNGTTLAERYVEAAAAMVSPRGTDKGAPTTASGGGGGGTILDLFTHRFLFVITTIQIYSWFVNSATYYGLTLAASASATGNGGNRYLSTALSGAVEIPAYVLTTILLTKVSRLWTLCGFMVSGGVALLAVIFTAPISASMVDFQALFCKLCISASFSVIYIHSSEVFPTSIRNTGVGLVSVAARVGGILAPFLTQLGNISANLHFFVFGGLMLSSGVLNLRLPETQGLPLPETIQDLLKRTSQARVTPAPISGKKRKTDHRSGGGRGYRKIPQTEEDFELEASREEEKA